VLAIEPGLYIPEHPRFGPFAGIGVRIEDDVAVTSAGAQVLSDNVPVDADAVEALVGAALEEGGAGGAGGGGRAAAAAAAAAAAERGVLRVRRGARRGADEASV
jgi:hypothetical protein